MVGNARQHIEADVEDMAGSVAGPTGRSTRRASATQVSTGSMTSDQHGPQRTSEQGPENSLWIAKVF